MVIGNAMTASAVALNRLGDEMRATTRPDRGDARARARPRGVAAEPSVRRALRSGTITLVDSTKTTGLIFFPGTMVGMLLAGADPIDAVRLQLILLYMLLGSVAISALTSTTLAYRNFFTSAHQLRDPESDPGAEAEQGSELTRELARAAASRAASAAMWSEPVPQQPPITCRPKRSCRSQIRSAKSSGGSESRWSRRTSSIVESGEPFAFSSLTLPDPATSASAFAATLVCTHEIET